jgi:DNA-binding LacI/PurR family transcriptional regulator
MLKCVGVNGNGTPGALVYWAKDIVLNRMARKKSKRITIRDIAQELGVTPMTVSRALNDRPDISPETKQKVIETARRLEYVQSALGRGLASGYAKAVGCVVTTLTDPFVGRILEGIETLAQEAGFAMIVTTSQPDSERQAAAIDTFSAYRVGGIIVMCSRVQQLYMPQLVKLKSPLVLINSEEARPGASSIRIDNVHVAKLAVSHLIELGHRRIAHIKVRDGAASGYERWLGYKQTLEAHDLVCNPALTVETENSEEGGAGAATDILNLKPRPTAIFCYNDRTAVGALTAIRRAGLSAPQDISVAGIDNSQFAAWVSPALTTVRQPARQMGRMAMAMVLERLAGQGQVEDIVLPGELIVRESTALPPVAVPQF